MTCDTQYIQWTAHICSIVIRVYTICSDKKEFLFRGNPQYTIQRLNLNYCIKFYGKCLGSKTGCTAQARAQARIAPKLVVFLHPSAESGRLSSDYLV